MSNDMLSTSANLVDMDDRQLSADLDKRLIIQEDDDVKVRGPSSPKKENTFPPCRFTGQLISPPAQDPSPGSVPGELNQHPGQNYGFQYQDATVWDQYRQPQQSLSSDLDLETDKDQSISDTNYIQPTDYQHFQKGPFQSGFAGQDISEIIQSPNFGPPSLHHGYQGQQADYYPQAHTEYKPDVSLVSDSSLQKTQTIQDTQQQQLYMPGDQVSMTTGPPSQPMIIEPDEQGECALHVLSVVDDKGIMAIALDVLLMFDVVQQCINLQNKAKQTPLFLAIVALNIPLIGWLLQNGADPDIQGTVRQDRDVYVWRAPLHLAAMAGDAGLSMLHMLIKAGADINSFTIAEGLTPLHVALKCHSETFSCRQTILEFIKAGAMKTSIMEQRTSKTPLIMAIETRDLQLVQDILEQFDAVHCRSLLQEQTRSGDTCLHIAAGLSQITTEQKQFLLRLLIIKGANGNIANNIKELPRDFARLEWDKIRTFTT